MISKGYKGSKKCVRTMAQNERKGDTTLYREMISEA